jgi:hypothetical protein
MFLTDLELIADPKPDLWRLGAPLVWCDPVFGRLEVPAGFLTDLASIPRAFRNLPLLDPDGASRRPAAMHDYLYGSALGRRLGKTFADSFLRASLMAEGLSPRGAWVYWAAVHYFGGPSWRGDAIPQV